MNTVIFACFLGLASATEIYFGNTGPDVDLDLFSEANRPKVMYSLAIVVVASLLTALYWSRGPVTICSILSYVGALSSMSVLIRNVYVNNNFKYPQFLTATHFIATAMVGASVLLYRNLTEGRKINVPDLDCWFKGLVPVAVSFVFSLGMANNGLLLTNAHFYEMIGSSTPLVTAGIALMIGRGFDVRLSMPLALITAALFVVAFGEVKLTVLGLLACIGGVIGRGIKSTLQHSLMGGSAWKSMDPIEVAVWTSLTCLVMMAVWSAFTEGLAPCYEILSLPTFLAVLYTCAGASILNIAALFVLRELGPVTQQVVGQLKGILAILGSVAAFGETVTLQQIVGYSFLIAGIAWYNKADMDIKDEKKQQLSKEADETTKIQKV